MNCIIHCEKGRYHREAEPTCDFTIVIIPLLHLRLSSSKVGADKTDAGRVEQQADGHTPFIARGPAHSSFDSINSHVPGKGIKCPSAVIHFLCKRVISDSDMSCSYLMKGACWGRMKTNRHTPTSCSEASSTYL